jgi:methylated-DNA-[protein]-cysteine S-methyltransferase
MPTDFQIKVWQKIKKIPKGKVSTYKLLAFALKNKKAYQAVGQAVKRNPYWPKVPCHRIVKSNGEIGGFASGSRVKKKLLEKEGIGFRKDKIIDFKKYLYRF